MTSLDNLELICPACAIVVDTLRALRCTVCGGGLEVRYGDLDLSERQATWPPALDRPLHERYQAWLPNVDHSGLSMGEGTAPLLRSTVLADTHPGDVYLANEGMNPTGSFKDRGTATAMAFAFAAGFSRMGVISSGNMACSVAAYAARAGSPSLIVVSTSVPAAKLRATAVYGGHVLRVDRDHGSLFYDVADLDRGDIAFLNSDHPFRLEGQKTCIFDLYARLGSARPSVIVVPVSSGGNVLSILKGLRELADAGVLARMPRVVGVQPAGCAPIVGAAASGAATVTSLAAFESIAGSISNPNPPAGNRVLAAVQAGQIELLTVTDDEMLAAQLELGATGTWVQLDSASVIAAVRQLSVAGRLQPDEAVACILTGAGHRDPAHPSERSLERHTRTIAVEELGSALSSLSEVAA